MKSLGREESFDTFHQVFQLTGVYYTRDWGRGFFPFERKGEKGLDARRGLPGRWYGARLIKRQVRAEGRIGSADAGSPMQTDISLVRLAFGSQWPIAGRLTSAYRSSVLNEANQSLSIAIDDRRNRNKKFARTRNVDFCAQGEPPALFAINGRANVFSSRIIRFRKMFDATIFDFSNVGSFNRVYERKFLYL